MPLSAIAVLAIGAAIALMLAAAVPLQPAPLAPGAGVAEVLVSEYRFSLLAVCLALIATLVGSVIIARREA